MGYLIAVVDVDPTFLQSLDRLLRREGFLTLLLRESTTAWQTLARAQPDLIILDPWLESLEAGWALLDALWQSGLTAHIPVILCPTDERLLADQVRVVAERQYALLVKPFDLNDFFRIVAALLGRRSGRK